MAEVELDGFPFWLQASSSEITTCRLLPEPCKSLSVFWERRQKLKQCQFSQDYLAHWSLDAAWIG